MDQVEKTEVLGIIMGTIIILAFIGPIYFLQKVKSEANSPKFNIGDCLGHKETDSWQRDSQLAVKDVGNYSYLYHKCFRNGVCVPESSRFSTINSLFTKYECWDNPEQ